MTQCTVYLTKKWENMSHNSPAPYEVFHTLDDILWERYESLSWLFMNAVCVCVCVCVCTWVLAHSNNEWNIKWCIILEVLTSHTPWQRLPPGQRAHPTHCLSLQTHQPPTRTLDIIFEQTLYFQNYHAWFILCWALVSHIENSSATSSSCAALRPIVSLYTTSAILQVHNTGMPQNIH